MDGWLGSLSQKVHLFAQEGRHSEPTGQGGERETTSAVNGGELQEILMLKMETASSMGSLISSGHSF